MQERRMQKYGHLPSKIVISIPWEALWVNLVGPFALKGRDGSAIDFVALTMIDPTSSCFKVMELQLVMKLQRPKWSTEKRKESMKKSTMNHLIA
jgi:hypothetical protein